MNDMEKLNYNIVINATPEKVWKVLWSDDTYRKWTSAFAEGSCAETDWKQGSKVLFHDGKGSGMVSRIAENRPNEYMSFEHLGEVKDGVEDTTSEKVKIWAGSHENYTLKNINGKTELTIDMDINEEFKEMFAQIWPVALNNVKQLSEN
jgi:L-rhamnose mutarotase